jgi:hypothetical protein
MVATAVEQSAGVPASTPSSAYFVVPEGELGQLNNALVTVGHSLDPFDLRGDIDSTITSIKQTLGLASAQTTAWHVVLVTGAAKVYALEQAGLTAYTSKAAATAAAGQQNINVNPKASANACQRPTSTGLSGDAGWISYLACIVTSPQLYVRLAEGLVGGMILYLGIKGLSAGTTAGSAASSATKPVRKAAKFGVSLAAPETRAKRVISKAASEKTRHTAKGLALSKKTTGTYHGAGDQAKTASKAATASKSAARTTAKTVAPKAAPRPTAAQLRAQLASRGNQLAPRVNTNGGGSIGTW